MTTAVYRAGNGKAEKQGSAFCPTGIEVPLPVSDPVCQVSSVSSLKNFPVFSFVIR